MRKYIKKYAGFLGEYFSINEPVRVIFDCSNGTTGPVLKELVKKNNLIEAYFINDEPDGLFPGHGPDPLMEGSMDNLRAEVSEKQADLGVIFDGDGDRVLFTDNKSSVLDARDVFYILAPLFDEPYVVDVSMGKRPMEWLLPSAKIIESKTGRYFLEEIIRLNDIDFGAERSGHFYFRDFFHADSGIFAAVLILNRVSELKMDGKTLAELRESIPKIYFSVRNFSINEKKKAIKSIEKYFGGGNINTNNLDGLTVEGDSFWLNIRPSNTEPLLRLNLAAKTEEELKEREREILNILR